MSVMKKDPDANWKVVMVYGKGTALRTCANHRSKQLRRFDSVEEPLGNDPRIE
jgi:hypothetical protein